MSFSSQAQVDAVLKDLKGLLTKHGSSVMDAFHAVDKDNSNQLSAPEFAAALKSINITLPGHVLHALIGRFDANGDGTVSIPEFSTFLSGQAERMDALRSAEAVVDEAPTPSPQKRPSPAAMAAMMASRSSAGSARYSLSTTDRLFISRMEGDIESRRRASFLNELKKDPRFKPSMLEPPKPRFQTVELHGGPIIKTHKNKMTGLETKKPYKWGPLGGYY